MNQPVERRFLAAMSEHLVSLPFDLKVLFEAKDDPDLDRKARETACGAILYVLTKIDVAGEKNIIGYADDVVVVRLALASVVPDKPVVAERLRDLLSRLLHHFGGLLLEPVKLAVADFQTRCDLKHGQPPASRAQSAFARADFVDGPREIAVPLQRVHGQIEMSVEEHGGIYDLRFTIYESQFDQQPSCSA